jgi:uncharacterized protein YjfI (DUF2170 family)
VIFCKIQLFAIFGLFFLHVAPITTYQTLAVASQMFVEQPTTFDTVEAFLQVFMSNFGTLHIISAPFGSRYKIVVLAFLVESKIMKIKCNFCGIFPFCTTV